MLVYAYASWTGFDQLATVADVGCDSTGSAPETAFAAAAVHKVRPGGLGDTNACSVWCGRSSSLTRMRAVCGVWSQVLWGTQTRAVCGVWSQVLWGTRTRVVCGVAAAAPCQGGTNNMRLQGQHGSEPLAFGEGLQGGACMLHDALGCGLNSDLGQARMFARPK